MSRHPVLLSLISGCASNAKISGDPSDRECVGSWICAEERTIPSDQNSTISIKLKNKVRLHRDSLWSVVHISLREIKCVSLFSLAKEVVISPYAE